MVENIWESATRCGRAVPHDDARIPTADRKPVGYSGPTSPPLSEQATSFPMPTTIRTACTRDCPDACGLVAHVRDGRVTRLSGDPDHPVTRGFLCYRTGARYLDRHYAADRLRTPLLRQGDEFVPIDWDQALDRAATEIERVRGKSGAASILHVQGGGSLGILKKLNTLFFRHLGGATETRGEVCDGAGSAANEMDFGRPDANDPEQLLSARGIIIWGKNLASSTPHTVPFINQARKKGTPVLLIDPLPHKGRGQVEAWYQPRPGGDAALALGIARVVVESERVDPDVRDYCDNLDAFLELVRSRSVEEWAAEADLPVADLHTLATFLADRSPVTGILGWGMQRRNNGATQVRAIDALFALTGNIGRPGAGAAFTTARSRPFDLSVVDALADRVPRTLLLPLLGQEILAANEPEIRAVVIDNANPVATCPDSETTRKALLSREFVLVMDAFLTDTARAADLVLPSTLMLEESDLVGSYGHHYVTASRPVVERLEGTRTDLEVYQALAERLGFGEQLAGEPDRWIDRLADRITIDGVDRQALQEGAVKQPDADPVAFAERRFDTPSGRLQLLTEHVSPPADDPDYPLRLLAVSSGRWQASQLTAADEEKDGPLLATLHPASAAGIKDGETARLTSRIGTLEVTLRHDKAFRRDTVHVPRARAHHLGRCVNVLIRPRLTDHGEGCAFYDEGVRLEPAGEPGSGNALPKE